MSEEISDEKLEATKFFVKWMISEARVEQLEEFVRFIANDYFELSHDKVRWQRDEYIKKANKLMEKMEIDKYPMLAKCVDPDAPLCDDF